MIGMTLMMMVVRMVILLVVVRVTMMFVTKGCAIV